MEKRQFGLFLKNLRKEKKLTLKELSNLSGVSPSYLVNVENGKRGIPSPEILQKLVEPLEISYEELMVAAGYLGDSELVYIDELLGELEKKRVEVIFKENVFESYTNPDGSISTKMLNRQKIINRFFDIDYILKKRDKAYINGHELSETERQTIITLLDTVFPQYREPKN